MKLRSAAIAGLLMIHPALAAEPPALGFNAEQPIAVNAESFTADLNAEAGTYTGNVIVVQGEVKLRADTIVVTAPQGKASRMEARGNVIVDSPSGTAKGDAAVFDVPRRMVRLTGRVVLTKDDNVMRGTALEVEIATGKARLTAGAADAAQSPGRGRVEGLFNPQGTPGAGQPGGSGNP